jgi:hypothetical protein
MNVRLILIVGGFALGFGTAGAIGLYMLLTRSYRKARNRVAIHLGQVFVVVSAATGLLLLRELEQSFAVVRHSSAHYSAIYAHVFGLLSAGFLVLRAEFRWRRSSGLSAPTKSNRPVVPGAFRKFLITLGIMALSIGFSIAFWLFRPKPISVVFGGISWLFAFTAMIVGGRAIGGKQMREGRIIIFVLAAALFCMFAALAWKFRDTDPALSYAWLVNLSMPCIVALSAFFFMRPGAKTDSTPN